MKAFAGDWFALLFIVAIIYVLVRPDSNAAQFVQAIGRFGRALVASATDTAR
jgi:superfamily II DNA or RNA helicase